MRNYYEKYGSFLKTINGRGLKFPCHLVCQWTICSYIFMPEVVKYMSFTNDDSRISQFE